MSKAIEIKDIDSKIEYISNKKPSFSKNKRSSRLLTIILSSLLILAVAGGIIFFFKYNKALSDNPNVERDKLVAVVGRSVSIPNEQPVVLTVLDKNKLSNQALAGSVENGDKILVFSNSKKLIVYRPSIKKVADILTIQNTDNLITQ